MSVGSTVLIGVDCACQVKDIGIARAEYRPGAGTMVTDVLCGKDVPSVPKTIADWVTGAGRCLFALDAPLGWPEAMGSELGRHRAGAKIATRPNDFFRRETDRDIQRRFGKTPLDVGADRIARTAHAALTLLDEVRQITGREIPLAWRPLDIPELSAIEVYPAGTLLAHRLPASGYKKPGQRRVRSVILDALDDRLALPEDPERMLSDADCLDAVLCILAAGDFLSGQAVMPPESPSTHKEGWIWVRDRI